MKIAILDSANNRSIVAQVPDYLANSGHDHDTIAYAIFDALGLSGSECQYLIGDLKVFTESFTDKLENLTQNFKADALASLSESEE